MIRPKIFVAVFIPMVAGLLCLLQARAQMGPLLGVEGKWTQTSRGGGGNQVTVQDVGTFKQTGGGATNVGGTNIITVTSGAQALVVVVLVGAGTSITSPTATWNSVSMTLLANANAGGGRQAVIFGLRSPAAGANNLDVNWTGGTQVSVNAVSFVNVDVTNDSTAFPNNNTNTTGATPMTINITSGALNYVVGGFVSASNFSSVSDTQFWIDNTMAVWAVAANYKQATGASETLTGSPGNSSSTAAAISIGHN